MKNPLKKYAALSIIINILLMLIYGGCFAKKQKFQGVESISKSLINYNNSIEDYNDALLEYATVNLPWRHVRNPEILGEMNMNEMFVGSFSCEIDSLLNTPRISQKTMDEVLYEYDKTIDSLYKKYCHHLDSIQREAKLSNSKLQAFKEDIYQIAFSDYRVVEEHIQNLSIEQKKLLLSVMKTHLQEIQTNANWDFLSFFGYRAMVLYKNYPFFIKDYSKLKKGKETKILISYGRRIGGWYDGGRIHYNVFINGDKIDMSKNRATLTIGPTSNDKEAEVIVVWRNENFVAYGIDSSYFNYKITP